MKLNTLIFFALLSVFFTSYIPKQCDAQENSFDTVLFAKLETIAAQLVLTEEVIEYAKSDLKNRFRELALHPDLLAYAYPENNSWNVQFLLPAAENSLVARFTIDSTIQLVDSSKLSVSPRDFIMQKCLLKANLAMQTVMDTNDFYFSTLLIENDNKTLSVWFLPAFQPSGQALYGEEWCLTYDSEGEKLVSQHYQSSGLKNVWIGQPRELWLNFRDIDFPNIGSLFFVLKYRDYFTRLRIDTKLSVSTIAPNVSGNYEWEHKIK